MLATLTFPAIGDPHPAQRPKTVSVRSADDLRRALREARECALALDASALNCVLRLDARRGLLEVQAAMRWGALADYLGARGVALDPFTRPAGLPASVGDAVSANPAGPDGAPFVAHVEAITLVTPDGELRRADRDSHADLFRLAVGGQGVFGVLYSVTLRLESLLRAAERAVAPAELDLPAAAGMPGVGCEAELFLPPEQLDCHLAEVRELAAERRIALQSVRVRRLQAEEETFLRWASREWAGVTFRFHARPTLGARVHAAEIRQLLLAAAVARGGSFPIAAARDVSRFQLEGCYPKLSAFLAEKRRHDPAERLQNDWYRRVTGLLRREPCDSRWAN